MMIRIELKWGQFVKYKMWNEFIKGGTEKGPGLWIVGGVSFPDFNVITDYFEEDDDLNIGKLCGCRW